MGAWIETFKRAFGLELSEVAPRVGAWIETSIKYAENSNKIVAPRVGAWIETFKRAFGIELSEGRAPCGRVD